MPPEFHFVLTTDRLAQAVVGFAAVSVLLLLALFVHTAASQWFQVSRVERRARRVEQRLKHDHSASA